MRAGHGYSWSYFKVNKEGKVATVERIALEWKDLTRPDTIFPDSSCGYIKGNKAWTLPSSTLNVT